jgi:hypothetical protein
MAKLIAVCGIDCAACPAYIAFTTNDEALREKTAVEWSKSYGHEMKAADVNCAGCTSASGPHIGYCDSMCELRKCAVGRKVRRCGDCPDYACQKLEAWFENVPQAKANLEELRRQ